MAEISKEYAEALFELACEDGTEEATMDALRDICEIFREEPEYEEFLASPGIPQSERLSAVSTALEGKFPERVVSYVSLLCEKGRIGIFGETVSEFGKLLDARRAVITAKVTSAVELTAKERDALKQKLEKISASTVTLDCHIDPDILGGVIVEIDGRVIDGSLRHRLREVKEVIDQ